MVKPGLTQALKNEAARLGFDAIGIAPAVAPPGYEHFREWLRKGHAAEMAYMHKHEDARAHPSSVLAGVRSVIVASMIYGRRSPGDRAASQGKVARYARGADYHEVLWTKLGSLLEWLRNECPGIEGRAVADTAPLMERDFAQLAGLGWIGKNTMLINRKIGSFTVLGAVLVDQELEYDPPHETFHCGTCTRCLDACPTDAFSAAFELDARRCLSYWTIEHRGTIPDEIAGSLDGWVFGCDICQEVCPWNRKPSTSRADELKPRDEWENPDLLAWIENGPDWLRAKLRGTALRRAKPRGLVRNAALVLGVRGVQHARPALTKLLLSDEEEVREAASWALKRLDEAARGDG